MLLRLRVLASYIFVCIAQFLKSRRPLYANSFWSEKVHGYYDNKPFPAPLTPAQRKRFKQTRIVGHLRLASEGTDQGFTKPREKHSFIGLPSVIISAVASKDRIIVWHVSKRWNGEAAAAVYRGPMRAALRRTWGVRKSFTIVEDGDRKGNQSEKAKKAKKEVGIHAMVLAPRSPCWMPLDYGLWDRIIDQVVDTAPAGVESKDSCTARLEACAKSLPRGTVAKRSQR